MKKILSGLAALLLISLFGFNQEVKAQDNTGTIETAATLVQNIIVTAGDDLLFGNVLNEDGEIKIIGVANNVLAGSALGGTVQTGTFDIEKPIGSEIILTIAVEDDLSNGTQTLGLSFPNSSGDLGLIVAGLVELAFDPTNPFTLDASASAALVAESELEVRIGGAVEITGIVPDGLYEGSIRLTVTYN